MGGIAYATASFVISMMIDLLCGCFIAAFMIFFFCFHITVQFERLIFHVRQMKGTRAGPLDGGGNGDRGDPGLLKRERADFPQSLMQDDFRGGIDS